MSVRPVMTYGLKNLVVRSIEKSIMRTAEKWMLQMMCGVQIANSVSTKMVMVKLGLVVQLLKRKGMVIVLSRCRG